MPIHPTAIVSSSLEIDPSNDVGPGVILEAGVRLGSNNRFHAYSQVLSGTTLGDDNELHSGAIVGNTPQDTGFSGEPSFTKIGNRNVFREHVTVHRGTAPGSTTVIGDDCFFMGGSHVGHNCDVGNSVTLANCALLGGHVQVGDRAFLSGHTAIHQFVRVGTLVMYSGSSVTNQDIPPYMIAGGRRSVAQGVNVIGLRRAGFSAELRLRIQEAFKVIYRSDHTIAEATGALSSDPTPEVQALVEFIRSSKKGIVPGKPKPNAAHS